MKQLVLVFVSAFLQVFFIGMQTKNIECHQYGLAVLTSFGIGISWIYNVNRIVNNGYKEKVAYLLGGTFGIVSAMFLYDRLNLGGK